MASIIKVKGNWRVQIRRKAASAYHGNSASVEG
jgi:hypothetical protein